MQHALTLIADIISIGDLVLEARRPYFQWLFERVDPKPDQDLLWNLNSAYGLGSNLILEKLGLHSQWGQFASADKKEGFKYPRRSAEEYGLLFYILSVKSGRYAATHTSAVGEWRFWYRRKECFRYKASDVIKRAISIKIKRSDSNVDVADAKRNFMRDILPAIDEWLISWGCDGKELSNFDKKHYPKGWTGLPVGAEDSLNTQQSLSSHDIRKFSDF